MKEIKTSFFIFLVLMLATSRNGKAQNDNTNFSLNSKAHYGFIIAHRDNMGHLIKGHVPMIEVVYSQPSYGDKKWEQLFNYPTLGISIMHADLANPKQLGSVTAIFPHINFKLNHSDRFMLNLRYGTGFGYFNKTFNIYDNYKNNIISSHINPMLNLQLESRIKISKRFSMENGIALTHFSNGSYKIPNLGLNLATVNTGFTYQFGPTDKVYKKDSIAAPVKRTEFSVLINGALKEILPAGGRKYPVYILTGNMERQFNYKHRAGIGLDLFYNSSLIQKLANDSISINSNAGVLQAGLSLSYALTVHRISIIVGMGTYVYSKYKGDGFLYHRIGTRYRVNDRLTVNATLKTHFAVADHWEFGMGYLLKR